MTNQIAANQILLNGKELHKEAIEYLQIAMGDLAIQENSILLQDYRKQMEKALGNYINEYDIRWQRFDDEFNVSQSVAVESKYKDNGEKKNYYTSSWFKKVQDNGQQAAIDFIKILYFGEILLQNIRDTIFGKDSHIDTVFYFGDGKGKMSRIKKEEVDYDIGLSVYGASGNNYVSLAYDIGRAKKENTIIEEDISQLSENKVFFENMSMVKDQYVQYLNTDPTHNPDGTKNYTVFWDSTDAEIVELYLQTKKNLFPKSKMKDGGNLLKYKNYRQNFGRGGNRTTALQSGDIDNIQVKLFNKYQKSVNFARQTLVRKKTEELMRAFSIGTSKKVLQSTLKEVFLPKGDEDNLALTEALRREGNKALNKIMRNNIISLKIT